MAMDFFEHQAQARKNTGRLVVLFALAVICIIAMVYVAVAVGVAAIHSRGGGGVELSLWNPLLLLVVGAAVLLVVGCSSAIKLSELSGGGRVIAESLGGRLLDTGTTDLQERQLLNVVEEMSIASGVPMPDVYVMDNELAINAFAAGYGPDSAVIGVTRGTVELLDRDELQGVIAHEYSHILNGDMRLNIRLIGVLFGILVIGQIGMGVLRTMRHIRPSRRSSSSKKNDGAGGVIAVIFLIAAALMVIGFVGYFFGGLIKSAVSRQREFLADASAVQFTRYPEGIGGALKKIGGNAFGSSIHSPKAEEVSHMFFGQGVTSKLGALGATHPPLDKRIRRIMPKWDGRYPVVERSAAQIDHEQQRQTQAARNRTITLLSGSAAAGPAREAPSATEIAAVKQIGQPTDAHWQRARDLLQAIPPSVKEAIHSSLGACAVIYAMLLSGDEKIRAGQLAQVDSLAGGAVGRETQRLADAVGGMSRAAALPLLDLAMPSLHNLTSGQYQTCMRCVQSLIEADDRMDMYEWMLSRVLTYRLSPTFEPSRWGGGRTKYYSLKPMRKPLAVLLSALTRRGHEDEVACEQAYAQAVRHLPVDPQPGLLPVDACGIRELDKALTTLRSVGPREKRAVINACAVCITADKQVTPEEAELLRAVCDCLDVPMPPLLPGQALV